MLSQDLENKKSYVYFAYPGEKWKQKVNRMSTAQIIAVYYSLKEREDKKKQEKFKQLGKSAQLTIFDYLVGKGR